MKKILLLLFIISLTTSVSFGQSLSASPGGLGNVGPNHEFKASPGYMLSMSNDNSIVDGLSIACGSGDTGWLQIFDLSNDFGINGDYAINSVEFALESVLEPETGEINLYLLDGAMSMANLTLLHTEPINFLEVINVYENYLLSEPVIVPAGKVLVVEVLDYGNGLNGMWIGANATDGIKPSYIRSNSCSVSEPATLEAVGFPGVNYVIHLYGSSAVPAVPFPYHFIVMVFALAAIGVVVKKRFF